MVRQGWGAKVKGAIPKVGRFKARVCQTQGGKLSIWAKNLQSLRRSRRRKNRQGRLQRSRKAARLLQRSKLQNPRSKKGSGEFGNRGAWCAHWLTDPLRKYDCA